MLHLFTNVERFAEPFFSFKGNGRTNVESSEQWGWEAGEACSLCFKTLARRMVKGSVEILGVPIGGRPLKSGKLEERLLDVEAIVFTGNSRDR